VARGLLLFGSDEQKKRFLPPLASGEKIAAFALTEHFAGSDAGSIRTTAVHDAEAGVYLLTGEKPWVTNGEIADIFVVFARTNRVEEGTKPHLLALIVERGPGVVTGARQETLGVRGVSVTELRFEGVNVPVENVLGEVGKGFKVAMWILNDARITLSAALVGQCRELVNVSVKRVAKRRSFGRVIGEFPILKDKVAKMMSDTYAVESMTYLTAGLADRGVEDYSLESAICRVASSEALWRVVNEAMQAAAGLGYLQSHPLERALRDARAGFVLDGTNETLRCFIALAGMRGPGQRMSEVQSAMYEPIKGFGLLRDFAVRKVREALRREQLTRAHPVLDREAVGFEELVDDLARAVDRALREHNTEIAEMQYPQLRLANIAIDLYALLACLSRTTRVIEERGESGARRHIDLTIMFAAAARGRIKGHLERLEHNDDELRKLIASRTYTDGGYPFDVV
jgi:acyl-CoA dehydrogenase family member 9